MLYVSEYNKGLYGVKDSDTNELRWFNSGQLKDMYKKGIKIKGVGKDYIKIHVIKINPPKADYNGQKASMEKALKQVIEEYKAKHGPYYENKVREVVSQLPIGTRVIVDYRYKGDGDGIVHKCKTTCIRNIDGRWYFYDENNTFDGQSGDDGLCVWALDVSLCGGVGTLKLE